MVQMNNLYMTDMNVGNSLGFNLYVALSH